MCIRDSVYSDAMKTALAGVPAELIAEHGAVSEEVAKALAAGIRQRTGATLGVGVTGIAGPTGGSEEKPVGLVYIAVSDPQKTEVLQKNFRGDRERVRQWTCLLYTSDVYKRQTRRGPATPRPCAWPISSPPASIPSPAPPSAVPE